MKRLVGLALFLTSSLGLFAFRWPFPEMVLHSCFGVWQQNTVSRGLNFERQGDNAIAIADGELLFHAGTGATALPGNLPLPGGSLVAVAHRQELLSVYTGLRLSLEDQLDGQVFEGDVLGTAEPSSRVGPALYLFDRKAGVYINPLAVLPQVADTRSPVLRSLILESGGQQFPLDKTRTLAQGEYRLLLDAQDPFYQNARALPYTMSVLVNGTERQRLTLDALKGESGKLLFTTMFNRQQPAAYNEAGLIHLGTYLLAGGTTTINLVLNDLNGNKLERGWSVIVP